LLLFHIDRILRIRIKEYEGAVNANIDNFDPWFAFLISRPGACSLPESGMRGDDTENKEDSVEDAAGLYAKPGRTATSGTSQTSCYTFEEMSLGSVLYKSPCE
jgi:hypothetical protein